MSNTESLKNGIYSGSAASTHFFNDLTFNLTNYNTTKTNNEFHTHTNAHVGFVLDGNYIENRTHQKFYRKTGDLIFCNAFEAHKFQTQHLFRNLNIEISQNFLDRNNLHENQLENNLCSSINAKTNLLKMFFELYQKDENIETTLEILLLEIIQPNIEKPFNHDSHWHALREIISDKWNEKITLAELSESVQIHPVTISKHFSKYFGCTFGEYLRQIKVNKSIELLKSSSLSTTEIAYRCGFADQSHFIRTFKTFNGFTPKQFKNY